MLASVGRTFIKSAVSKVDSEFDAQFHGVIVQSGHFAARKGAIESSPLANVPPKLDPLTSPRQKEFPFALERRFADRPEILTTITAIVAERPGLM